VVTGTQQVIHRRAIQKNISTYRGARLILETESAAGKVTLMTQIEIKFTVTVDDAGAVQREDVDVFVRGWRPSPAAPANQVRPSRHSRSGSGPFGYGDYPDEE